MRQQDSKMAGQNEEEEQTLSRVQQPDPDDILCGKDKNCVHAPGSIRFRKIIESYRQKYANCLTKFDKMLITKEIYETLSATSRFLKYNNKEKIWEEISPMAARDKCGHALRFANRLKAKSGKMKDAETQEYAAPGPSTISVSPTPANGATPSQAVSQAAATVNRLSSTPTGGAPGSVQTLSPTTAGTFAQQQAASFQDTPAPSAAQPNHQQLWGELAKRYNSLWSATHIPALGGGLSAPMAAQASGVLGSSNPSISALAAAAAVNSSLMASLSNHSRSNASTLAANASSANCAASAIRQQALLNAVAAATTASSPAGAAQHPQRKPTLDDLCSIIGVEHLFGKPSRGE